MIRFGRELCNDLDAASEREWIVTNGIGGFASSTVIGANTRRYHGLLIASYEPPLDRHVLLAGIEEEIGIGGTAHELATNQYRDSISPAGYRNLASFSQSPL